MSRLRGFFARSARRGAVDSFHSSSPAIPFLTTCEVLTLGRLEPTAISGRAVQRSTADPDR